MRMTRWVLVGLAGLLVVGCVSPTLAPTRTPAPTYTSAPTATTASPPTSTVAPTPTRSAPTIMPTEVAGSRTTITILYDYNPGDSDKRLETAWGFSCLVEGPEKTILFDTGGDSATLLRNMRTLGIDPRDMDVIVISHVHGDHVGGLAGFLEENHAVTVYLP